MKRFTIINATVLAACLLACGGASKDYSQSSSFYEVGTVSFKPKGSNQYLASTSDGLKLKPLLNKYSKWIEETEDGDTFRFRNAKTKKCLYLSSPGSDALREGSCDSNWAMWTLNSTSNILYRTVQSVMEDRCIGLFIFADGIEGDPVVSQSCATYQSHWNVRTVL